MLPRLLVLLTSLLLIGFASPVSADPAECPPNEMLGGLYDAPVLLTPYVANVIGRGEGNEILGGSHTYLTVVPEGETVGILAQSADNGATFYVYGAAVDYDEEYEDLVYEGAFCFDEPTQMPSGAFELPTPLASLTAPEGGGDQAFVIQATFGSDHGPNEIPYTVMHVSPVGPFPPWPGPGPIG